MKKFMTSIDLNYNQIINTIAHGVETDPTYDNIPGRVIYNTTENKLKYYNGERYVECGGITGIVSVENGGTGTATLPVGEVLVGDGINPVKSVAIDSVPVAESTNLITSGAVVAYMQAISSATDCMIFKGTIASDGTISSGDEELNEKKITELTNYMVGWTFRAAQDIDRSVMTIDGLPIQAGDMLICIKAGSVYEASLFSVIQTNIDGAISSVDTFVAEEAIPVYADTTGRYVKSSGVKVGDLTKRAVNAGKYISKNPELTPESGVATWTVEHNLGEEYTNTQYPIVRIVENATNQYVECDVTLTDSNTVTINMNSTSVISANTFTAIVSV